MNRKLDVVAITGRGAVGGFGSGIEKLVEACEEYTSALERPSATCDAEFLGCFVAEASVPPTEGSRLLTLAIEAGQQALKDSGMSEPFDDVQLVVGSGSGLRSAEDWILGGGACVDDAPVVVSDRFNFAERISRHLGTGTSPVLVNTACTSSSNAFVHGYLLAATGRCADVLCIGADEIIAGMMLGFRALGALSEDRCFPYHSMTGTSFGDGAAAVVLSNTQQSRSQPRKRWLVAGVGQSADAYHATRSDPQGRGLSLAITRAKIHEDSSAVLVSGHGSGTQANDTMEIEVYGDHFRSLRLYSTKGVHGHAHGACGILELIILVEALDGAEVHSKCFAGLPSDEGDYGPLPYQQGLKVAIAMGGLNTVIAVKPSHLTETAPNREAQTPSCFAELGFYGSDWTRFLYHGDLQGAVDSGRNNWVSPGYLDDSVASLPVEERYWNERLDELLSRMVLCLCNTLVSGVDGIDRDSIGISYATRYGPSAWWVTATEAALYGRKLNPRVIPRLSCHFPASVASEVLGLRGPLAVYMGTDDCGKAALDHAIMSLEMGLAQAMIVTIADEYTGLLNTDTGVRDIDNLDLTSESFKEMHRSYGEPRAGPAGFGVLLANSSALSNSRIDRHPSVADEHADDPTDYLNRAHRNFLQSLGSMIASNASS